MENNLSSTVTLTLRLKSFLTIESHVKPAETSGLIAEALGYSKTEGQFFASFDTDNFTLTLLSAKARPVGEYGCLRTARHAAFHTRILQCKDEALMSLLVPDSVFAVKATVYPTGGKVVLHFESLEQLTVPAE